MPLPSLQEIIDTFEFVDEWEDRYAYVIELGKSLPPYPEDKRDEEHRVRGCASQVWLSQDYVENHLQIVGDGDAFIVRGLVAIVVAFYSGLTPKEILERDAFELFNRLGFTEHISTQRANGLRAMVARIREEAQARI